MYTITDPSLFNDPSHTSIAELGTSIVGINLILSTLLLSNDELFTNELELPLASTDSAFIKLNLITESRFLLFSL